MLYCFVFFPCHTGFIHHIDTVRTRITTVVLPTMVHLDSSWAMERAGGHCRPLTLTVLLNFVSQNTYIQQLLFPCHLLTVKSIQKWQFPHTTMFKYISSDVHFFPWHIPSPLVEKLPCICMVFLIDFPPMYTFSLLLYCPWSSELALWIVQWEVLKWKCLCVQHIQQKEKKM